MSTPSTLDRIPPAAAAPPPPTAASGWQKLLGFDTRGGGVGPLSLGVATLWLSLIVLLPLAAIVASSLTGDDGVSGFWTAVTDDGAIDALWVTVLVSAVVAVVNVIFGTLIAWVLVRDNFPGKAFFNAIIDLPFALPTIVASIVLLSLYGPNSPVGISLNNTRAALVIALAFVTLPFVVRAVQPVLIELELDVEQAAASLGANNFTIFTKIIFPALLPSVFSGAGLAFSRALGEFGSVVLIGGNIPGETQVASQYIQKLIEVDDQAGAAAVSVVLLLIACAVLFVLRVTSARLARHEEQTA